MKRTFVLTLTSLLIVALLLPAGAFAQKKMTFTLGLTPQFWRISA